MSLDGGKRQEYQTTQIEVSISPVVFRFPLSIAQTAVGVF